MKIIQRQDTIQHYSVDPYYFDKHMEVERNYSSHSRWQRTKDNTHLLTCGISYIALDKASGDQFIKYESHLMLHCAIEDIETDIFDIVQIKENTHISAVQFIKQNSLSFFNRLSFPADIFSETRIMSEKRGFYIMTEGKVPFGISIN